MSHDKPQFERDAALHLPYQPFFTPFEPIITTQVNSDLINQLAAQADFDPDLTPQTLTPALETFTQTSADEIFLHAIHNHCQHTMHRIINDGTIDNLLSNILSTSGLASSATTLSASPSFLDLNHAINDDIKFQGTVLEYSLTKHYEQLIYDVLEKRLSAVSLLDPVEPERDSFVNLFTESSTDRFFQVPLAHLQPSFLPPPEIHLPPPTNPFTLNDSRVPIVNSIMRNQTVSGTRQIFPIDGLDEGWIPNYEKNFSTPSTVPAESNRLG
ncbi:hypothetical protein HK098_004699 [Nowakowskiella sp. JEL0407]|nr:hypothetical protein HK098_004699 [Nowakowskiella sp. JEL0407]